MKWSDHNLMWGRPLRSIFASYNNKRLSFNYEHLVATDEIIKEDRFAIDITNAQLYAIAIIIEKFVNNT